MYMHQEYICYAKEIMYTSTGMPGKDSLPVPLVTKEILLEADLHVCGCDPQVETWSLPQVLKVWQTVIMQYQLYYVDWYFIVLK